MKYLHKVPSYAFLLAICFIVYSPPSSGQSYISKINGSWTSGNTWNVLAGCTENPSGTVPPLNKDWGCPVTVKIQHQVHYPASLTNFGNGLVNGIEISPAGSLTVNGDFILPAHGWGSLTYLRMGEGSSLNVLGTLSIGKAEKIVIPKNTTVTVGNLIVDDNSGGVIIEEGAELIVLNATTIKSKSTLHIEGKYSTKTLTNNTGNLVSSGGGTTKIEGDLYLNGSASLISSGNSKITSAGSLITTGAGLMNFTGNSQISFAGDMSLSQGSRYAFNDNSDMKVGGHLSTTGGAIMTFNGNAKGKVDKDISLRLGAILTLNDKTTFSSGSNVSLFDGTKININGHAEGVIGGDVDMRNGEITTSGNSTLHIDKTLIAYRDRQVNTKDQSGLYICDYVNSTQIESKFINTQPQSYYGPGCYRLPVSWLELKVTLASSEKNTVTWVTAKEWENCHFEIERSLNGGELFTKIGEVKGMGWSSDISHYSFSDDELPNYSGDIYYRIKQVDFNGQYDYSKVLKAKSGASSNPLTTPQWRAYPNPTLGNPLKISMANFDHSTKGRVNMRMISSTFQSETVTVHYGEELEREILRVFDKAPKGVVIIELIWEDKVSHLKVLKN